MLLQAYVTQHNYDIICLSETFLNSSIDSSNTRILIYGYNLIWSDHPSDSERGRVCIYYKEHFLLINQDDIWTLDNCLVTEIRSTSENCFLTCIYRSLSQNNEEFENFCVNFDLLFSNINEEIPICSIITGDFNAHSSNWWKNDITNTVGQEFDSLTTSAGYSPIIDKPMHIVNNSMSYIVLIFCTNTNVNSKHGVDVSIFEKWYHNIIFGKIDICVPLPPSYVHGRGTQMSCDAWDYSKANAENIKKAISSFNWNKAFENPSIDAKLNFSMKPY